MRNFIVLFLMLICLFGPSVVFTLVGYRAIETLGKRPSRGGLVMIPLLVKLVITAVILIGLLMVMLSVMAGE